MRRKINPFQLFETEGVSQEEYFDRLKRIRREMTVKSAVGDPLPQVLFDINSLEILGSSRKKRVTARGYFESTCYHPLLVLGGTASAESASGGVGVRRDVAKASRNLGPFLAVLVRRADPQEHSFGKSWYFVANEWDLCTIVPFSM
jgi:hypothetical protein